MDNKILRPDKDLITITSVLLLAVVLGIILAVQKVRAPMYETILRNQTKIIATQKRMEIRMGQDTQTPKAVGQPSNTLDDSYITSLMNGQATIKQKITSIEAQLGQLRQEVVKLKTAGSQPQRPKPPAEDFSKVYEIPVNHSPIKGDEKAPVTIVEFIDFQCPFCARFHKPAEQAVADYSKKANLIIKNFPLAFHPQSRRAAKAAFAAGEQGKYYEMTEIILKNGKSLKEDSYKDFAKKIGLNVRKFMRDLEENDSVYEKYIQEDFGLGRKVGVRGTPTFFINGKKTRARDLAGFKKAIDKAIKESKK